MSEKIIFDVNEDKTIETVVWIVHNQPNIDVYHIVKVLYYADKKHLNRYARPISGDTYIKMKDGPVPSLALDIINANCFRFSSETLDGITKSIETTGKYKNSIALREPDPRFFSDSDLECLKESLEENGNKSFHELRQATHEDTSWIQSDLNSSIDYLLLVEEDNPLAEDIKKHISTLSAYISM